MKVQFPCPKCGGEIRLTGRSVCEHFRTSNRICKKCGTVWRFDKQRMTGGAAVYGLVAGIGIALISLAQLPFSFDLIYIGLWILFCWFVVWPTVWKRCAKIEAEVKAP